MLIREMQLRDKEKVKVFFQNMKGESRAFFNRGDGNFKSTMKFFDGEAENIKYFIAVEAEEMLGYVFLMGMDTLIPELGIAVAEHMKGKGIGYQLMTYAENYAKSKNKGGITLITHVANLRGQSLYEKCGFSKIGIHGASGEIFYLKRFKDENYKEN